jgi:protoheme IX farnesyltransferase
VAAAVVVGRQIAVYAWATVATSLALWPVASTGWLYPSVAVGLGIAFLGEAHALWRRARTTDDAVALKPMRLFHLSNAYLALLFLAMALDPLLTR